MDDYQQSHEAASSGQHTFYLKYSKFTFEFILGEKYEYEICLKF
jgi:hypothetical protein